LEKYSAALATRVEMVVGSKLDLTDADAALAALCAAIGRPVLGVSGVSGAGLLELAEAMWTVVERVRARERAARPTRLDLTK
jgi:GTPase involved in cell partitioning and DNA repair